MRLAKILVPAMALFTAIGLKVSGCLPPLEDTEKVDPSLGWDWLFFGVPVLILLLWWRDIYRFFFKKGKDKLE